MAVLQRAGYLVEGFVIPVRVDFVQLSCNPVVFSHDEGVGHGQDQLFVDTRITCSIVKRL